PGPVQERDHAGEHVHPDVAEVTLLLERAQHARADDHVRLTVNDRPHHGTQFIRVVLTIGIKRRNHHTSEPESDLVSDPEVHALPAPYGEPDGHRPFLPGHVGGPLRLGALHHAPGHRKTFDY